MRPSLRASQYSSISRCEISSNFSSDQAAEDLGQSGSLPRKADHPLGCHKPRIPDRVIFGKLLLILIFGCAYDMLLVRLVVGTDPDDGLGGEAAMDRALLGDLQKL